jgi:site-specific recombinase XerD
MGRQKNIMSVDELIAHFPGIRHLSARVGEQTLFDYRSDATLYLRFVGKKRTADCCGVDALRDWRTHQVEHTTLSPNTINRRLMAIKSLVRASAAIGTVDVGVAYQVAQLENVKVSALRHRLRPHARNRLSPEDVRRICNQPNPSTTIGLRDRALMHVMASSGARIAEIVSLNREALLVESSGCFVQVIGKGKHEPRRAPLSRQAYDWVCRWLSVRDQWVKVQPIFTAIEHNSFEPLGHRISAETARRRLKIYAEEIGLKHVKPHDMRRFVGTRLTEKFGLRQAQLALGHASPDVTARFYVLDELAGGLTDGLY